MLYAYVTLIVLCETIALSCLKQFYLTSRWVFFGMGIGFYVLVSYLLVKSFHHEWTYPRLVGAGFGLCGLLEL